MYIPGRGDLIWISLTPRVGHEQSGRRPAAVLSPRTYNAKVGLLLACPITAHAKGYPFEVALPEGLPVCGVILSDQIRSLDWKAREACHIASLPPNITGDLLSKSITLLQEE